MLFESDLIVDNLLVYQIRSQIHFLDVICTLPTGTISACFTDISRCASKYRAVNNFFA